MKHLFLLPLLLCLFAASAGATTFSGTVTNTSTSSLMVGQKVYLMDSLAWPVYLDSTTTNSSGVYTFTIPSGTPSGDPLTAYTRACGLTSYATVIYAGSSITQNFSVCSSSATYSLQGNIFLPGSSSSNRHAMIYLIRKQYDSVLADTTLTAIDSIPVNSGSYYSKTYSAVPYGTILLKIALQPTDSQYNNYLPTYFDSALQWSGARALAAGRFNPSTYTNLYMIGGINPGGAGFIGGSVILGANKATGAGDPLARRIIMITNASSGKAVGYTYSDPAGHFSFPNLAYGTYKLFGDVWGKTNPALTVTISAANGTVSNVLFKENRKDFTGQIGGLGLSNANPLLAAISAYPNPAHDYVEVGGLNAISGNKTITLSAMNGAVISRQEVSAGQSVSVRLSTSSLAAGIYLLRVQTAEGSVQIKLTR